MANLFVSYKMPKSDILFEHDCTVIIQIVKLSSWPLFHNIKSCTIPQVPFVRPDFLTIQVRQNFWLNFGANFWRELTRLEAGLDFFLCRRFQRNSRARVRDHVGRSANISNEQKQTRVMTLCVVCRVVGCALGCELFLDYVVLCVVCGVLLCFRLWFVCVVYCR